MAVLRSFGQLRFDMVQPFYDLVDPSLFDVELVTVEVLSIDALRHPQDPIEQSIPLPLGYVSQVLASDLVVPDRNVTKVGQRGTGPCFYLSVQRFVRFGVDHGCLVTSVHPVVEEHYMLDVP